MDSKLCKHSVDVDDSATVAHVKLLLASMSLVPAGLVPKLVYQKRMLSDDECVGGIGYSTERIISLVCVRSTPASTAAGHELHSVSSRSTEPNPSAAAQQARVSPAAGSAAGHAPAAVADVAAPSSSCPEAISTVTSAAGPLSVKLATHASSATQSAAQAPAPAPLTLQPGSRVRVEGLHAAPEMNGRAGTRRVQSGAWAMGR